MPSCIPGISPAGTPLKMCLMMIRITLFEGCVFCMMICHSRLISLVLFPVSPRVKLYVESNLTLELVFASKILTTELFHHAHLIIRQVFSNVFIPCALQK